MATVDKDFRVKHGLVVEGTTATVGGEDVITTGSTTDDLAEGSTNKYFTDQRAVDAVSDEIDTAVTNAIDALDTDDIEEGATNQYYTETRAKTDAAELLTGATLTNITITGDGTGLTITAENGGIQDLTGFDTDDLSEGATNQYFTNQRALDATASAYDVTGTAQGIVDGLDTDDIEEGATNQYFTNQRALDATASAYDATGTAQGIVDGLDSDDIEEGATNQYFTNQRALDATASAYEASGAVSTHSDLTTGVHGVSGDVVGTTDTQDLSNKRIVDTLNFTDGVTIANEGEIAVKPTTHEFEIKANYGNLDLKTVATSADVNIISDSGDIILDADGAAYIGTAASGNEIATQSYVDGLVQGLNVKESVRVASTANVANLTSVTVVDGVTLADGDRVILKNQSTATQNGIYVFTLSTTTLSRAEDQATPEKGDYALVTSGTYAATGWLVSSADPILAGILWTQFSAANEYTASTGITIIGNAISVTADTYDAYGAAAQALTDAEDYADGLASNYDAAGTAQGIVDDLDTDDIEEGATNLYFTNQRALDATASAYEAAGAAQSAVDALDTDDIEEGSTNLYFTNTRAVDAIEAVVPNFTDVEINSLAKQVAATSSSLGSVPVTAYQFAKASYKTAKFLVKISNGTENEVTEVLLTLDSADNIAITEYAIVGTNGSRGEITADINAGNVRLRVNPVNDSTINVVGTLLV
jgi:hypothetical protein